MRKLDFGFRREAEEGLGPVGEFVLELAGDGAVEHAPGPVAAQCGRGVDARLVAQVEQILHGVDARVAHAGGDGAIERICQGVAGLLMGVQGCLLTLTRGGRSLKPTARRLVVVGAHVGDGVGDVKDLYIESVVYKGEQNEIILESDERKWLMLSDTDEQVATYVPLSFDFSKARVEVISEFSEKEG